MKKAIYEFFCCNYSDSTPVVSVTRHETISPMNQKIDIIPEKVLNEEPINRIEKKLVVPMVATEKEISIFVLYAKRKENEEIKKLIKQFNIGFTETQINILIQTCIKEREYEMIDWFWNTYSYLLNENSQQLIMHNAIDIFYWFELEAIKTIFNLKTATLNVEHFSVFYFNEYSNKLPDAKFKEISKFLLIRINDTVDDGRLLKFFNAVSVRLFKKFNDLDVIILRDLVQHLKIDVNNLHFQAVCDLGLFHFIPVLIETGFMPNVDNMSLDNRMANSYTISSVDVLQKNIINCVLPKYKIPTLWSIIFSY